jgi:5-methylcytosine-specific restriction endonuclease McrA
MAEKMRNTRRQTAWDMTGGRCFYCQSVLTPDRVPQGGVVTAESRARDNLRMQIDHKLAPGRGGTNDQKNLVPSCGVCNTQKGDMTPDEFRAWLFRAGVTPQFFGDIPRDWLSVGTPRTKSQRAAAAR